VVAVVTGATRGLGHEVARQLHGAGWTVALGARDPVRGRALADEMANGSGRAWAIELDVEDDRSVAGAAAAVQARIGRVDLLVNNAGVMIDDEPPAEMEAVIMERTLAVNVVGVVRVTRAFLPLLRLGIRPRIVNVSSEAGSNSRAAIPGDPVAAVGRMAYMASKAALNSLTLVYAHALATDDIGVVAVSPGYVATELNGYRGDRTVVEGAATIIEAALGPTPSGSYVGVDGPIPW